MMGTTTAWTTVTKPLSSAVRSRLLCGGVEVYVLLGQQNLG